MNESIIISLVVLYIVGVLLAYLISILFDSNYTVSIGEVKAKVVLWPLTLIIYIMIGVIILLKYVVIFMIDILKGFWQFIKSIPEIIVDL